MFGGCTPGLGPPVGRSEARCLKPVANRLRPARAGRRFDPVAFLVGHGKYAPTGVHLVSKTGTSAARSAGVRILYFPRNGVSDGCRARPVKPWPSAGWVRVPRRQRSDCGSITLLGALVSTRSHVSPPSSADRASGSGPEGAWFESTGGHGSPVNGSDHGRDFISDRRA